MSLLWTLGAPEARAAVITNAAAIALPVGAPGPATPYPSTISVGGLPGTIVDVDVSLSRLSHTAPNDLEILVVGPNGQSVVLMADRGDVVDVIDLTLTFDDGAVAPPPHDTQITPGVYRPGAGNFVGAAPAPTGPHGTTLSVFNGMSPNGSWSLFVFDDANTDTGSIAGGWSIDIDTTAPAITSFAPTSGPPGTSVTIIGTNLSGATAVMFGGAPAAFTPVSATQVNATVPASATTGPISVAAAQGTAVSSTVFTVVSLSHSRDVSLNVGQKARGRVSADDAFTPCASKVPVKVQRKHGSTWRSVGAVRTDDAGRFVVPGTRRSGSYRAIAPRVTLPDGVVCSKAVSRTVRK
jgi:hypothetical protein